MAAAAAEGLEVTSNEEALLRGRLLPVRPLPAGPGRRAGHVGGERVAVRRASRRSMGKEQKDKYVAERYHQPSDEILPWFTYDGALQQLRVTVRTAVSVANAPAQPQWQATSEFREAGEARRKGAGS